MLGWENWRWHRYSSKTLADAFAKATSDPARGLHHPPRAKRVIYLFMAGAPSQLELFDYKPKLVELEGKPIPPSVIAGQRYAFIQPDAAVLSPRFKFARHGQSGAEISEVMPHLASVADDIAIIRSVHTDQFNHSPAQLFVNTGSGIPGRPAMGAWLSYGIGSEASDLPGFVVLKSGGNLSGGAAMWSSGFLPGEHQGVPFRASGDPILNVTTPRGISPQSQRETIDLIGKLNRQRIDETGIAIDCHADRVVRDGLPHADASSRADGLLIGRTKRRCRCMASARMTRARSPRTVCLQGEWPSGVCGLFNSITPVGIITATSKLE